MSKSFDRLLSHAREVERARDGGVPSDILSTAMKIMASSHVQFSGGIEAGAVVRCIVDGILVERERCALLIEHRPLSIPDRQELADDIRSGALSTSHQPTQGEAS